MSRLTHCVLVLSVDVSLGATGGEEEDVVPFVGGDSLPGRTRACVSA